MITLGLQFDHCWQRVTWISVKMQNHSLLYLTRFPGAPSLSGVRFVCMYVGGGVFFTSVFSFSSRTVHFYVNGLQGRLASCLLGWSFGHKEQRSTVAWEEGILLEHTLCVMGSCRNPGMWACTGWAPGTWLGERGLFPAAVVPELHPSPQDSAFTTGCFTLSYLPLSCGFSSHAFSAGQNSGPSLTLWHFLLPSFSF